MLLRFSDAAQVNKEDGANITGYMSGYLSHLQSVSQSSVYTESECSVRLPFDENNIKRALQLKDELKLSKIKEFVLIGIGGSSLGTKAVTNALGIRSNVKFHFMGTVEKTVPLIESSPQETLINVISKSGSTFETLTNLRKLLSAYPGLKDRVVFTTSNPSKASDLQVKPLHTLEVPEKVGGRYSVFSGVGLLPLLAAGIDILGLLEGAMLAVSECLEKDMSKNPALFTAASKFLRHQKGKSLNIGFYFHPQLESLGKWWQQLTAESLGKQGKGITPIVSIGTNDLHSMLQLYLEGPKDKFTEFVYADRELVPEVRAILQGVKKSYSERNLPFIEENTQDLSEKTLGHYMQTKMIETMFLARMMKINAFDQPSVESYKQYTRDSLLTSSNVKDA